MDAMDLNPAGMYAAAGAAPALPLPPPPATGGGNRGGGLGRLLAEHNPFYLFSAACMLASCLALTNSLSWDPIRLQRLLLLILTLNLYEIALIALGLFLVVRRGLVRDGRMLLVLEAFFLVDVTFLNAEVVSAGLQVGLVVNVLLFVLAAMKIAAVARVLKPTSTLSAATSAPSSSPSSTARLPGWKFGFVLLQLAVLFALPCVFAQLDHGGDAGPRHGASGPSAGPHHGPAGMHFYAAWWVVGLLPAVYELFAKAFGSPAEGGGSAEAGGGGSTPPGTPQAMPALLYLALPWASLLLHLGILHYVYDVTFFGADLAPVLLGFTLVLNRVLAGRAAGAPSAVAPSAGATPFVGRRDLVTLRLLLPAAAMLASLHEPSSLSFLAGAGPGGGLYVTPLKLATAGAYLTYVYCYLLPWAAWCVGGFTLAALAMLLGPSLSQVMTAASTAAAALRRWVMIAGEKLIPSSSTEWGVVGLVGSFLFLVLGAAVSLRKSAALPAVGPESPTPPGPPEG